MRSSWARRRRPSVSAAERSLVALAQHARVQRQGRLTRCARVHSLRSGQLDGQLSRDSHRRFHCRLPGGRDARAIGESRCERAGACLPNFGSRRPIVKSAVVSLTCDRPQTPVLCSQTTQATPLSSSTSHFRRAPRQTPSPPLSQSRVALLAWRLCKRLSTSIQGRHTGKTSTSRPDTSRKFPARGRRSASCAASSCQIVLVHGLALHEKEATRNGSRH